MNRAEFHPEALDELDEIATFLRGESPGLDSRFTDSFDTAMQRVFRRPHGGRPTLSECRLTEIPRFNYNVIYQVREDDLRIIAIAHVRRRPGYWADRVD